MTFPYPYISNFTSSYNSASYFSEADAILYNQTTDLPDLFFGKSERDVSECSYYNTIGEQNGWKYKKPSIKYLSDIGVYKDVDSNSITYNYRKTITDYINYKNNFLLDIKSDLSSSNVFEGQHVVSYNFLRNVAGSQEYPLIISDISPSRTELKLIPSFVKRSNDNKIFYENLAFESFSRKLVLIEDIVELLSTSTSKYNCNENYKNYSVQFPDQILLLKKSFGFKTDEDTIIFINNIYNGAKELKLNLSNQITIKNLFGINNHIKYWLYTYSKNIVSFDELFQQIRYIIEREYLTQLEIINIFNSDLALNLQIISNIVYELFVKQVITIVQNVFVNKFYSYYKNGLNFGNGVIIRYLDHSYTNQNETDDKHIELLIKLDSPLSNEYDVKTLCWISNVSIAPIVQSVILINKTELKTFNISGPDFSIPMLNSEKHSVRDIASLNNNVTDRDSSLINTTKKLKTLNIDYSDFSNFVLFSSAAVRIKIFKNKLESINKLNSNIEISSISASYSANLIVSSSFTTQIQNYKKTIDEIFNSFDGFESYLYTNQNLISGSLDNVNSNYYNYILDAEEFDTQNLDNLTNNTPENIKNDENNSDYLLFLTMIGHHFDNIYLYIRYYPILNNSESSDSHVSDFVYYMLKTFGWNTSTDFANKNQIDVYLNNKLSYKDKTETIWKRILDTLPQIYKTKGAQECINLILACHGIPLNILTIREFGNNDVYKNKKTSYLFDAKYYFTKYNSSNEFVEIPYSNSAKSLEFTFKLDKDYNVNDIVDLASKDNYWKIYLQKTKQNDYGNIYFKLLDKSIQIENVPVFNKDRFYNVLLRRNNTSSYYDTNIDENYVPIKYDLIVKSHDADRETFSKSGSIFLTRTYNESFVENGSLYFGNYSNSSNKFTGLLDKINLIKNSISDEYFDEYSKNFNFYGNSESENSFDNLIFKYNFDYPVNLGPVSSSGQLIASTNSASITLPLIPGGSYYYRAVATYSQPSLTVATTFLPDPNFIKLSYYPIYYGNSYQLQYSDGPFGPEWINYGNAITNLTSISPDFPEGKVGISGSAYNFSSNSVTQSNSCTYYSQSIFPYQFFEVNIAQSLTVSKFGPNKLKNNKIRKIEQELTSFPSPVQSVVKNINQMSPDSNILGVYVSPFKSKDDDIINFYGDLDLMDYIGDPGNIFESKYKSLNDLNENYYKFGGERVLYQEFLTIYKNYIDNSIFDTIKNIVPARTKFISGILIEPSLLERSKIPTKPIYKEEIASFNGSVNIYNTATTEIFPVDSYNILVNSSEKTSSYVKSYNVNNGYISSDGNEYYFNQYIQQDGLFYDNIHKSSSFLRKIEEIQELYGNESKSNPISINLYKVISVPSSSYVKQIGEPYILNANNNLSITNIYPFQHLSYKNKPLEKFQIYLNTSSYVPIYYDKNDKALTVSDSSIASINFSLDQVFVKSRNTTITNIISPYEITSSVDSISYSPVLTQSLSLSQSIFII